MIFCASHQWPGASAVINFLYLLEFFFMILCDKGQIFFQNCCYDPNIWHGAQFVLIFQINLGCFQMTFSYEIKALMNYKKRPKVRKINAIGQTLSFTWSVSEVCSYAPFNPKMCIESIYFLCWLIILGKTHNHSLRKKKLKNTPHK